ncbi:hypothetical protein E4U60_007782 [Claviceps pazoutovae]|uniref:Uncharacterized protein n=1 Tax=Claviceps pazoutovae TaxID=1649127 RepID=A0A9P7SCA9_9HYPO|nr:hypothetical protein E4U60_007782 [Claviceps pazoutovae]
MAAGKHDHGDEDCPVFRGESRPHCLNCSGPHVAWSRECPTANAQWDKARAAYLNRPTHFANPAAPEANTDASRRQDTETPPSQEAPPRRKVGRPPGSRNRVQNEQPRIMTRLTRATSERARRDETLPPTRQTQTPTPATSTTDSHTAGTAAPNRL